MAAANPPSVLFSVPPFPAPARIPIPAIRSRILPNPFPVLSSLSHLEPISTRATLGDSESTEKYVYPEPIPEFAKSETKRFRAELRRKLCEESETLGNDLDAVLDVCSQIFSEFLHDEYGGPGTLQVEPFTDMMAALKDENLPGAAFATRAALLWAQNYVDQDWDSWNASNPPN